MSPHFCPFYPTAPPPPQAAARATILELVRSLLPLRQQLVQSPPLDHRTPCVLDPAPLSPLLNPFPATQASLDPVTFPAGPLHALSPSSGPSFPWLFTQPSPPRGHLPSKTFFDMWPLPALQSHCSFCSVFKGMFVPELNLFIVIN